MIDEECDSPECANDKLTLCRSIRCNKKPRLLSLRQGKRDRKINIGERHKTGEPWIRKEIIEETENFHGIGALNFDGIPLTEYDEIIEGKEKFIIQCNKCSYMWKTNMGYLNKKKCQWCTYSCKHIQDYDLYTLQFVSEHIFQDRNYNYTRYNSNNSITSPKSNITVWCGSEDHEIFTETIGEHLSKTKRLDHRSDGCPECKKLEAKDNDPDKRKPYSRDVIIRRSTRIHGNVFDFSEVADINHGAHGYIILTCLNCNHRGEKKINDLIGCRAGCWKCYGSEKFTRDIFIQKMNERYIEGEFIYDLIKEEDITCKTSKPKVKCSDCSYIIDNTIVSDFLHCPYKKECDRCYNHQQWNPERLENEFIEREKLGKFKYTIPDNKIIKSDLILNVTCLECIKREEKEENTHFNISINDHFYKNYGCKRCSKKLPWDYKKFLDQTEKLLTQNYIYDDVKPEMITCAKSQIPIKCKTCKMTSYRTVSEHVVEGAGCRFCNKSIGSKTVQMVLMKLELKFKDETKILGPEGYYYFYDYLTEYQGKTFIIEYDGEMHQQFIPFYHTDEKQFLEARKRDIFKHFKALENGHRIIRIDHKIKHGDIEAHIKKAFELDRKEYFSTPSMYKWMIQIIPNSLILKFKPSSKTISPEEFNKFLIKA